MMVLNFLYSNSYHFFEIIIIFIFLVPTASEFGLFLWRGATYY